MVTVAIALVQLVVFVGLGVALFFPNGPGGVLVIVHARGPEQLDGAVGTEGVSWGTAWSASGPLTIPGAGA